LRTKIGNQFLNAVYLDADTARVGIFDTTPDYTLDVNGDFRAVGNAVVDGNLTVNGEATYINVGVLRVEDKNIELGLLDDSTEGADADVDNAGIIVRSTDGSKDFVWQQQTNAFYTNVNIDVMAGREYKINGQTVLSVNSLPTVTSANSLQSIGTLNQLQVDNIAIDGSTLSTTANVGLTIDASGDVSLSNSRLTDLNDPVNSQDAATKNYVDTEIDSIDVAIALDITGLTDRVSDVAGILNQIASPLSKETATEARIHATSYDELIVTGIDIQSAANISTISVLTDDSSAESVVQDISFAEASGSTTPIPNRRFMVYEVVEVESTKEWSLVSDTEL